MSKLYKLTKNSISLIRKDAEGVREALEKGFVFMGECDGEGNVIDADAPVPGNVKPEKKGKK